MDAIFDLSMETVIAVSGASRLSKDSRQGATRQQERKKNGMFSKALAEAITEEAPAQFKTVVYGRNGKMSMINYQTRNY